MPVLIADHAAVAELLPMRECMRVMEDVLRTLARGDAILPLRQVLRLPDGKSAFAVMPAYLGAPASLGVKVITVFPGNEGTPYDSHQGAVLLFEAEHGRLAAVLDATSITAIRTAAISGVATRLLAREDAGDLAILGSGTQARTHLAAMALARPLRRVRAWSPTPERLAAFVGHAFTEQGIVVIPARSAREAVEGADIICTVTSSREPVLMGEWIAAGAHVNAVGASLPIARELDSAAVARARLFVDRRESALNEAGDFLVPKREGAIGDDHIRGEIGELLLGRVPGRRAPDEITVFKSLGLAVEDVAAAHHVHARALDAPARVAWVDLGGERA